MKVAALQLVLNAVIFGGRLNLVSGRKFDAVTAEARDIEKNYLFLEVLVSIL